MGLRCQEGIRLFADGGSDWLNSSSLCNHPWFSEPCISEVSGLQRKAAPAPASGGSLGVIPRIATTVSPGGLGGLSVSSQVQRKHVRVTAP